MRLLGNLIASFEYYLYKWKGKEKLGFIIKLNRLMICLSRRYGYGTWRYCCEVWHCFKIKVHDYWYLSFFFFLVWTTTLLRVDCFSKFIYRFLASVLAAGIKVYCCPYYFRRILISNVNVFFYNNTESRNIETHLFFLIHFILIFVIGSVNRCSRCRYAGRRWWWRLAQRSWVIESSIITTVTHFRSQLGPYRS